MNGRPTKTDALIRDIAKLFVTYSPSVWRPVLDELAHAGGAYEQIARHMEDLLAKSALAAPKRRASKGKPPKKPISAGKPPSKNAKTSVSPQMNLDFSVDRQATLNALATELNERRLLPTAGDIRHVYLESGGKGDLPKVRKAAILHLLRHLDAIPASSFQSIHQAVQQHETAQDTAGDYQRWFKLIRRP